ncbi:glycoside hydrolase family 32 protein [Streptococcus suis]|nr:glycoside hydrolase family 32 protein [Streptococcus suis]
MKNLKKARDYVSQHHVASDTRPRFHVSPPVGWLNDPNGLSEFQGKVHLFYQYHPYDIKWGPMHWGHQVTEDMVVWKDLPVALAPDQWYDQEGCFSGSAVEHEGKHYLIYTGVRKQENSSGQIEVVQDQCLAVGDGVDYKKVNTNPVLTGNLLPDGFSREHFRDPKVWKEDGRYNLVAGNLDTDGRGQIQLFSSQNLQEWSYMGVLASDDTGEYGSMWECPDFFEIDGQSVLICSPQHMRAKDLEFHNGHNSVYFIGNYDRENHKFDKGEGKSLDYGLDFYAPQTCRLSDGRQILIGWMKSWNSISDLENLEWQAMMTLPRELSLEDGKLIQQPIRELEAYRQNKLQFSTTIDGAYQEPDLKGRFIDLQLSLTGKEWTTFQIDLACNDDLYTSFKFTRLTDTLEVDRTYSGLRLDQNCFRKVAVDLQDSITCRFILDSHSIELFINGGKQVFSMEIETPLEADGIRFQSQGLVTLAVEKYDIITK